MHRTKLWISTRKQITEDLDENMCNACSYRKECQDSGYYRCPAYSKIATMLTEMSCKRSCNLCVHRQVCITHRDIVEEGIRLNENILVEVGKEPKITKENYFNMLRDGIGKFCVHFEEVKDAKQEEDEEECVDEEQETLPEGED